MLCPYCNQEMEKGSIKSRDGIYWLPEGGRRLTAAFSKKSVRLMDPETAADLAAEQQITAYRCAPCKKIVIAYEESTRAWSPEDSQEG